MSKTGSEKLETRDFISVGIFSLIYAIPAFSKCFLKSFFPMTPPISAQTLRPRLRREGQSGLAHALYLLGKLHGKAVNAQGRKGDADLLVGWSRAG